jgi:hypothetical protein
VVAGGFAVALALVAAGAGIGIALRGTGGPPGDPGQVPPTGPPPALCATAKSNAGIPALCMSQNFGDGDTVYVVHGTGYTPGVRVTVHLSGHGVSRDRLVTDQVGTFNYAIDQGHDFFPGMIPSGQYTVTVTAPGGQSASTSFLVRPPGPPPGSQPGPPPGGQ